MYNNSNLNPSYHDWVMYRQQVTSSIAEDFLKGQGAMGKPRAKLREQKTKHSVVNEANTVETSSSSGKSQPSEDTNKNQRQTKSDIGVGKLSAWHSRAQLVPDSMGSNNEADRHDTYIKFGLPRVALPSTTGYTLTKPGDHFNLRGTFKLQDQEYNQPTESEPPKRSTSAMDMHRGGGLNGMIYGGGRGLSVDHGLDQIHSVQPSPHHAHHYAHSEIAAAGPSGMHNDFNHYSAANKEPAFSNGFLQNKRHHAQYFSNVDLFAQQEDGYNYLRYAKADEMRPIISKQPHLVLRDIGFEMDTRTSFDRKMLRAPNYVRILDGINLEAHGGETIAIMYTSEEEINILFGLIANVNSRSGNPEGSFCLNGVPMGSKSLGERVAYVTNDELFSKLTVRQHLKMAAAFLKPATQAFKASHMVSQLIQTLALGPFHDRMVCELGRTEKQRVKIACQILLDTDIIVVDNIIRYMDLYDAAFVIDYLRDWATKLNRIVIMATNPPTYEILSMFYKSAILASGRLVYFGRAQQMLPYFDALEYTCPLFKNPCDYYVDLVTRDHLTMDATMESSERIRRLADTWQQRQPQISDSSMGPVSVAPPKVSHVDPLTTVTQIIRRFWLLLLNQPCRYLGEIWQSVLVSLVFGVLYFHSTLKRQGGISDRLELFYILLVLCLMPNLWLNIKIVHSDRHLLYLDRRKQLYSPTSFFIAKWLFDLPIALISYAAYCIPVYFLVGLQPFMVDHGMTFGIYCAGMILHSYVWRMTSWVCAFMCRTKHMAAAILGCLIVLTSLSAGFTLHPNDHWIVLRWLRLGSPQQWTSQVLVANEYFGNATRDPTKIYSTINPGTMLYFKETIRKLRILPGGGQEIPILLTNDIISTGAQVYTFHSMTLPEMAQSDMNELYIYSAAVLGLWLLIAILMNCICVYCNHKPQQRHRHRD